MSTLIFASTVYEATAFFPDLVAHRIKNQVGCTQARCFAIQHAYCVSPMLALKIAGGFLIEDAAETNAMVVCADAIGGILEKLRPIANMGVHSDGAAAMILSKNNGGLKILDYEFYMDPSRFRGQNSAGFIETDPRYFLILTKLMRNIWMRNFSSAEPAPRLYPSNLDRPSWIGIADRFGIEPDRVHFGENIGHAFGADPFINIKNRPLRRGEYGILAASGVGGSYGAILVHRPERSGS